MLLLQFLTVDAIKMPFFVVFMLCNPFIRAEPIVYPINYAIFHFLVGSSARSYAQIASIGNNLLSGVTEIGLQLHFGHAQSVCSRCTHAFITWPSEASAGMI